MSHQKAWFFALLLAGSICLRLLAPQIPAWIWAQLVEYDRAKQAVEVFSRWAEPRDGSRGALEVFFAR